MKRQQFSDYESLSRAAVQEIISLVRSNPAAKICLPTGASPERTYELLAELSSPADFKKTHMIALDEWGGLPSGDPATCETYLKERVINPLKIPDSRFLRFCSDAKDPDVECERVAAALDDLGAIDLCILGLGKNGHLGLNEPADHLTPHAHVAPLTKESQQHNMIKQSATKPKYGLTLGISDILRSKRILMLVSGKQKSAQLSRLLDPKVETAFPASFLWLHPDALLFTDV